MILQICKPKLRIGWSFLLFSFLTLALLAEASSVRAQGFFPDDPHSQPSRGRSGEILGTVYLNRNAEPAPQVIVNIRSLSSGTMQTVLTDFGGRFDLDQISQGTYEVSSSESGYGFASTMAEVSFFPAQVTLYLNSSVAPERGTNAYSVSVRELEISGKAQKEYHRGLDLLAKSDFAGSLAHFRKAASVYPGYYEAIYQIGVAELCLRHVDQAIEAFQKAIDVSGGHYARAQFAYGLVLRDEREPKEAERLIRRGLESDPDSAEGHLFLGIALLDQNRLEEAEKSLREALLRTPRYADVYLVLADVHAKKKDYQSQVQDLDAYLKLAPSSATSAHVRRVRDIAKQLSLQSAPASTQH